MTFQIHALPEDQFADLFALSDEALGAQGMRRQIVSAYPGTPCRVSLEDAQVGETVLLLNYEHQPEKSPYQATHAIFVREGVTEAKPEPGTVPTVLTSRLISMRLFDDEHMMVGADVLNGADLAPALTDAFQDPQVSYIHLHNAKPGCFAARVTRVF